MLAAHSWRMGLGQVVAQRREARNWSASELARRVGVHTSSISRIEKGQHVSRVEIGAVTLSTSRGVPLATALGQALDGDPATVLELAGHRGDVGTLGESSETVKPQVSGSL